MSETIEIRVDHINEMHEMIEHQQETIDLNRRVKEELEQIIDLQKQLIQTGDNQIEDYKVAIAKLEENHTAVVEHYSRVSKRYGEILSDLGCTE